MNILAIIGSPRKHGNTYKLVQEVEAAMRQHSDVSFEYLYLADAHLAMCRGCFQCLTKGEDHCPLDDDRALIAERMAAADGIIVASPVYAVMVSALLKNMIDRMAFYFHRPRFFSQDLMVVTTSGGGGQEETLKYMGNIRHWGMRSLTKLAVTTPVYPSKALAKDERARKVTKAAQAFSALLNDRRPVRVSLTDMIVFQAMRGSASFAPSYFSADHAYYQSNGYQNARYFVRTRNGGLLYWVARGLVKLIGSSFEKRYIGG